MNFRNLNIRIITFHCKFYFISYPELRLFNSLLKELKKGAIEFNLADETQDLYHNICSEYLVQLNSELRTIYEELVDYELVEVEEH